METVYDFIKPFLDYMPNLIGALLVLVVGWLVIELLCGGLAKLLASLKLDAKSKEVEGMPAVGLSKLASRLVRGLLLIFLLLLVLEILGVRGTLDPVRNMFDKFLSAIPNLVAGLLIGVIGYIIAKILSSVVTALLSGADKFGSRLGLSESFSLARVVGHLVFIFTFVPILIAALDAVKIESVSVPATEMLRAMMLAVPNILAAALILLVAFFVGRFVTNVVAELLKNLGTDGLPAKLGIGGAFSGQVTLSKVIGGLLLFFIMLAASISAAEKLEMLKLSELLGQMTQFAADIALGLVILAIGSFLANVAYRALLATGASPFLAGLARIAIVGLVAAMGLRAMGIADDIVRLAFGFTVGSVAVAFALAFGLGGREAAGKQLEIWFAKFKR